MNEFNKTQLERLELEKEVMSRVKIYNKIEHPQLKLISDIRIRNFITRSCVYEGLVNYHMDKYERLKDLGNRNI